MDDIILKLNIREQITLIRHIGNAIKNDTKLIRDWKNGLCECSNYRITNSIERAKSNLKLFKKLSGEQYAYMLDQFVLD